MEIAKLSQNDDLLAVIRKCNINFRQLAFSARQAIKKQSRIDTEEMSEAISREISSITQTIAELTNVTLPQMVSEQVSAAVPAEVTTQIAAANIPQMVSDEVASQMVVPPVGSYLLMQSDPSSMYVGTTWQQNDTVDTTGGAQIPLWERTA